MWELLDISVPKGFTCISPDDAYYKYVGVKTGWEFSRKYGPAWKGYLFIGKVAWIAVRLSGKKNPPLKAGIAMWAQHDSTSCGVTVEGKAALLSAIRAYTLTKRAGRLHIPSGSD